MKYLWDLEQVLKAYDPLPFSGEGGELRELVRDAFCLREPLGNNGFSYREGRTLHVASVVNGDDECIVSGTEVVFEDWQDGELLSCRGLKDYVVGLTGRSGTPVYVCDNHNMVLEAWKQFAVRAPGLSLVHVDQHRDDAVYQGSTDGWLTEARICDYIDYAVKNGWISPVVLSYIESADLSQKASLKPDERFILNIDIDFFVPELTMVSLEEKIDLLYHYLPQVELITMATSPGFISQQLGIDIARLLWRYL